MLYILDQYGNKTELNPTFKMVGLPYKREYSTTKIPGLEGELQTTEPVLSSANRSIRGTLYGTTKEEVRAKRDELADVCGRGLIKVGHEEEGWFVEGQVVSFDHKYTSKPGRRIAEVSITLKCDDPHQKADEVVEELIITPSNYPARIEMLNPHPSANLRFGAFDVDTGEKISDESNWIINPAAIYTQGIGHGFTFDCYRGFSLSAYAGSGVREFKVFVDGVFREEVTYSGTSEFDIRYSTEFDDNQKHEVTIFLTHLTLYVDYIYLTPANLPVVINPGTVEDYPVLEVEPADTEAMFAPLGKKVGDADHPVSIWYGAGSSLPSTIEAAKAFELGQAGYDKVSFLNGSLSPISNVAAGNFIWILAEYNAKALRSTYLSMTVDEIKNHMQSILSELWGYARGAIEVGDPSFESGVNGFVGISGVTPLQTTEWAKTGSHSLKIDNEGSSSGSIAYKSYGNQAGKKITAKLTVYDPIGGANVRVLWRDATSWVSISWVDYVMSAGETKDFELECTVPSDCTDIRLYIYPNILTTVANYIYIDDVTATACGIDVRIWTDGDHWSSSSRFHNLDFPSLVTWDLDAANNPSRFVDSNGIVCLLAMAKYPSDGISSSAVYIDHCRLGTVMNYAKLGADAITNYGGNLLENGWGEHSATKGYPQSGSSFNQTLFDHEGVKLLYRGQQVTLSYEGWRDAEATKNNIYPAILLLHYLNDYTYVGYTAPLSLFANIDANKWERKTVTTKLKDDPDIGIIKIYYYRAPSTTLPGKVGIRNAVLVAGDKIIKLQPQELFIIGFSQDVVLIKDNMLSINPKTREINKDGASLYPLINQDFKFSPLQVLGGLNHFKISHTGANLKIRLKYQPKWR